MYKRLILISLILLIMWQVKGQETQFREAYTPVLAIKSNLLHDATSSMNLGVEFKTGKQYTLDLPVTYNPWSFSNDRKFKHVLVQPELRYWTCEPFSGHFFGLHAHYAYYNVSNFGTHNMRKRRYEGWLAGAGVSYGYHYYIAPRWNLGVNLGVGYAYLDYDKYDCGKCGPLRGNEDKHYFGITRAGVSLVFIIK